MSAEVAAIVRRYERRTASGRDARADLLLPNRHLSHQEKERAFLAELRRKWPRERIPELRVLEVGCGYGDNLLQFLRWGFSPGNLVGNELLPQRCETARARLSSEIEILSGDASTLELPRESFDIVLQSTVFTSILDASLQEQLAARMWALTAPGGAVWWYDFAYDNPRNADVKGVKLRRIRELFPKGVIGCRRLTLAPPIARAATRLSPRLYTLLNVFPFLRTHLFCVIEKQE